MLGNRGDDVTIAKDRNKIAFKPQLLDAFCSPHFVFFSIARQTRNSLAGCLGMECLITSMKCNNSVLIADILHDNGIIFL